MKISAYVKNKPVILSILLLLGVCLAVSGCHKTTETADPGRAEKIIEEIAVDYGIANR